MKRLWVILPLIFILSCEDKKVEIGDSDFTPFLVEDLNPNSSTYGKEVGPSFYFGKVL